MRLLAAVGLVLVVAGLLRLDPRPGDIATAISRTWTGARALSSFLRAPAPDERAAESLNVARSPHAGVAPLRSAGAQTSTLLNGSRAPERRLCRVQRAGSRLCVIEQRAIGSVGSPKSMNFIPWKKIDAGYQSSLGVIVARPSRS